MTCWWSQADLRDTISNTKRRAERADSRIAELETALGGQNAAAARRIEKVEAQMVRQLDDLSTSVDQKLAGALKKWRAKLSGIEDENARLESHTASLQMEASSRDGRHSVKVRTLEASLVEAAFRAKKAESEAHKAGIESDWNLREAELIRAQCQRQSEALHDAEKRNSGLLVRCSILHHQSDLEPVWCR